MSNMLRKWKRHEEKNKQINIKNTYGKKPKGVCPRCKRKTLFMTNKDGEVYCIRGDSRGKEQKIINLFKKIASSLIISINHYLTKLLLILFFSYLFHISLIDV